MKTLFIPFSKPAVGMIPIDNSKEDYVPKGLSLLKGYLRSFFSVSCKKYGTVGLRGCSHPYVRESLLVCENIIRSFKKLYGLRYSTPGTDWNRVLDLHFKNLNESFGLTDPVMFIKQLKWELSVPLALFLENSVDESPIVAFNKRNFIIFPKFFLESLVNNYFAKERIVSILFTFLQQKRSFPPLPNEFILDSFKKHRITLSTPVRPLAIHFQKEVRRLMELLIEGGWDKKYEDWKPRITPTKSATLENPTSSGGLYQGFGEIVNNRDRFESDDDFAEYSSCSLIDIIESDDQGNSKNLTFRKLLENNLYRADVDLHFECRAAAIQDPLKARIVTCNKSLHHRLKPVQETVSRYLCKRIPFFKYTREPVSSYLSRDLPWDRRGYFVSGDFSAATDNFKVELSEIILEVLMQKAENIDQHIKEEVLSSLTKNKINYPSWTKLGSVDQKRGQLMGSLMSFPVLCLGNLVSYLISVEHYFKFRYESFSGILSHEQNQFLYINGDDILFQSNRGLYETWWKVVSAHGLEPSVGKNYYNKEFMTINSKIYRRSGNAICKLPIAPLHFAICKPSTVKVSKSELIPITVEGIFRAVAQELHSPIVSQDFKLARNLLTLIWDNHSGNYWDKDVRFPDLLRETPILGKYWHKEGQAIVDELMSSSDGQVYKKGKQFRTVSYLLKKEDRLSFHNMTRVEPLRPSITRESYIGPLTLNEYFDLARHEALDEYNKMSPPVCRYNLSSPRYQLERLIAYNKYKNKPIRKMVWDRVFEGASVSPNSKKAYSKVPKYLWLTTQVI